MFSLEFQFYKSSYTLSIFFHYRKIKYWYNVLVSMKQLQAMFTSFRYFSTLRVVTSASNEE